MNRNKIDLSEHEFEERRFQMVETQLARRDIRHQSVLDAMRTVPRHEFVSADRRGRAYDDTPLSIGHDQTISQPYVVAAMTQALDPRPTDRILEIGTGCGYQTAVLAEIVAEVFTIEIVPELHSLAAATLQRLAYRNVHLLRGDGARGWSEHAPYDGIIVTAASPKIPDAVVAQLRVGGCMVVPLGSGYAGSQELVRVHKTEEGLSQELLFDVRFVPMRGEIESN